MTYVDSAELLSDYMEASVAHDKEKSSYRNFKQRYEESDVLLIDDVQYFQGKKQTLDIVFQIFNKMTDQENRLFFLLTARLKTLISTSVTSLDSTPAEPSTSSRPKSRRSSES